MCIFASLCLWLVFLLGFCQYFISSLGIKDNNIPLSVIYISSFFLVCQLKLLSPLMVFFMGMGLFFTFETLLLEFILA